MRKEEKAALDVLAKASDVHTCWAILDEAVTSDEDDQFTREYVEGEREMLEDSINSTIRALGALGGHYGIDAKTDNGSYAYMRKVREEHLTELERAKEFDRGYRAGRRSMDAERQSVALKLRGLTFDGSSHENLARIAYAIYPCATGWTCESADGLRDKLVRLLGGVNERETTLTTYDVLDNERHKAVCELRNVQMNTGNAVKKLAVALGVKWNPDNVPKSIALLQSRLIHLLGRGTCNCDQGGDHGDCAERRRAGVAGGDTDVLESTEISDVSNGIADELREFKGHINAGLTPEMVLALRAEVNGIANRIEEQFDRICQQQEAVLQETIEQLRRQMDQQRAMLTEQRDTARAKVIALCNERDKLQEKYDELQNESACLTAALDDMQADPANDIICKLERERDELQAKLDGIAGLLDG